MDKKNLSEAKRLKNDEFYTRLEEIESEISMHPDYVRHFKDKTVFCNCDDPEWSNFFLFFRLHFKQLGMKKLITTHFEPNGSPSYKIEWGGQTLNDEPINMVKTPLQCNGDFRSPECIELLKESDIVVTNPPFSLFRDYVAQLMEYNKKFVIIGNLNAITYKDFFPLLKNNKVWIGKSIHSGDREFGVPDDYPLKAAGYRVDENGKKFIRVKGVRWYTNLDIDDRHEPMPLNKNYHGNENYYPHYDNYAAINIDKTKEIPKDYFDVMGVPITFMDKYCPEQFEILGLTNSGDKSPETEALRIDPTHVCGGRINGVEKYARIFIRRKFDNNGNPIIH